MIDFGIRNLTIFFKDKTTVLLSFLAEFIIVGLYVLFIRDNLLASFKDIKNIELLLDTWMISGVLAITSVTTTMGAFGVMVDDRIKNINKDFYTSPIKRSTIMGGYLFSAVVIGFFMSIIVLDLASLYVIKKYGVFLIAGNLLYVISILFLVTISNTSLVLFFVSFIKSNNALAMECTIIGSLLGFLTGIYIPMGNLPSSVQNVVKFFPVSHGAVLIRQILLNEPIQSSFETTNTIAIQKFEKFMGVRFELDNKLISSNTSIHILIITAFCFLLLTMLSLCRKHRTE